MWIQSIRLNNFRLYKEVNELSFTIDANKNIYLIAGENGFGKSTFLLSLVWCLFGKQMGDVDDSIRKDQLSNGNYSTFLLDNLNKEQQKKLLAFKTPELFKRIRKHGYTFDTEYVRAFSQYSVSINFADIYIPSIPCNSVRVTRTFDLIRSEETIEVLIDGAQNELCTEIGADVFINDFILNKDIARFFFFDSEKIVSLAEINSISEKRKLSSAYNEVLGVKKYEDLKKNLENLRIRLRKKSSDIEGRNRLTTMLESQSKLQLLLSEYEEMIKGLDQEINSLKKQDDELQIQLMREGNSMTLENLKSQHLLLETVQKKDEEYKAKLKEMLDIAPFAIAGVAFLNTKIQVDQDIAIHQTNNDLKLHNELLDAVSKSVTHKIDSIGLDKNYKEIVNTSVLDVLKGFYKREAKQKGDKPLIVISEEQYSELQAIYLNITSTFKMEFERLADDYRKNRQVLERTSRKISIANTTENDSLIKKIRQNKNVIVDGIKSKDQEIRSLYEKSGSVTKELNTLVRKIAELSKTVSLNDNDLQKDIVAGRLINELNTFLTSLKIEKKVSLEKRIKQNMNGLMHKDDFIGDVQVEINDDHIDIALLDTSNNIINKESLSKGEQQLYATSILKSLVEESGIEFPVFIDSPLQKFDKQHSQNIISEFYPSISKQVILFPLLSKELNEEEFILMRPKVQEAYFIENKGASSYFKSVDLKDLFKN